MTANFPIVDKNRLISEASKLLFDLQRPSSWHVVEISGDGDFGFDIFVHLEVAGGIRHIFLIQLKGTESPDLIESGQKISFTLKRRTLNLYAQATVAVMLAVAVVSLDETGKLVIDESHIHWQWISEELSRLRGSPTALDESNAGATNVHVPIEQRLHARLDIRTHLERQLEIAQSAVSLEDILTQAASVATGQPVIAQLAEAARRRPAALFAWMTADNPEQDEELPAAAHEIRALLRAGNTAQAESALSGLMPTGFGSSPAQKSAFLTLRAKALVQHGDRAGSLPLFEEAYTVHATLENLLPLAEIRFLQAVDAQDSDRIRDVSATLASAETDDGWALRLRVHVALQEFDAAEACLARISKEKCLLPRLVLLCSRGQWQDAIAVAKAAESDAKTPANDMTGVQLIAARAAWSGATMTAQTREGSEELPLSGAIGTQIAPAREAWAMAVKALEGLKQQNWPPNIELITPIVCGVAGVLGQQARALELLVDAAAHRPQYKDLQHDLELLAIGAHEPETALTANLRQATSIDVLARRTSLLFEMRRYADCLDAALATARSGDAPTERSPMAVATGIAAAHRIGRHVEAQELQRVLISRPEWAEYLCFSEFARLSHSHPGGEEPLNVLRAGLRTQPQSWLLLANLFSNLDVNEPAAAAEAIELARQLRNKALFNVHEATRLVAAHTTLKNWEEAANEAAVALLRFKDDERLLSLGAIAQEMLGHTGAAWAMLDRALQVGTSRISVVHNYMGLALRLGRINAVRAAIDRLLELVSDRTERLELLRLSALIYLQEERSAEAIAAANAVGELVDPADEQEEGTYINLVMAVTVNAPALEDAFLQVYQRRIDTFCTTWPESRLFRRISLPTEGLDGTQDLHDLLDPLVGDSRARMREFEKRERQARSGELPIPFIVRPGFVLHYIGDAFLLWHVAMRSKPEDHQFHLNIASADELPRSPEASRDTPLLDLTSLLVLDSLDLFDRVFSVFRRVAVPSLTVGFISQHAQGLLTSGPTMEKAKSILGRINHWIDKIEQPSTQRARTREVISAKSLLREYADLANGHAWLSYCDDAITRAMIHGESNAARFFTTLDLLDALCNERSIQPQEVAAALGKLHEWNVAINVEDRYLIASLAGAVPEDFRGGASRRFDAFQAHQPFTKLSRAIWHPGKSAGDLVKHMAHLLTSMLHKDGSDLDSVAAVLASWHFRSRFLVPSEGVAWKLMCYPVMLAVGAQQPHRCATLVSVLNRAVTLSVGDQHMSVQTEAEVAGALGGIAGSVAKRDRAMANQLLGKLMLAMPHRTANGDRCMDGYTAAAKTVIQGDQPCAPAAT